MQQYSKTQEVKGHLRVADLAHLVGVTPATVRYYSRIGLLAPQREADNGYRAFCGKDVTRLRFIRRAQSLGLTISDVKALLCSIDKGEYDSQEIRALIEKRLHVVKAKREELQTIELRIARALNDWETSEATDLLQGTAFNPIRPGQSLSSNTSLQRATA